MSQSTKPALIAATLGMPAYTMPTDRRRRRSSRRQHPPLVSIGAGYAPAIRKAPDPVKRAPGKPRQREDTG